MCFPKLKKNYKIELTGDLIEFNSKWNKLSRTSTTAVSKLFHKCKDWLGFFLGHKPFTRVCSPNIPFFIAAKKFFFSILFFFHPCFQKCTRLFWMSFCKPLMLNFAATMMMTAKAVQALLYVEFARAEQRDGNSSPSPALGWIWRFLKCRLSITFKALASGSAPSSQELSSTMPHCYWHRTDLYVHLMLHLTVTCQQNDFFFHAFTLAATLNCLCFLAENWGNQSVAANYPSAWWIQNN